MKTDETQLVTCPYCGEEIEIYIELDVRGSYIQDCEVCCNPWTVRVSREIIRFIPGALLGAALGFSMVVTVQDPLVFFGVWGGMTVLVGVLSAAYGIEFWEAVRDRWKWWA
jgi:hypothetical protein